MEDSGAAIYSSNSNSATLPLFSWALTRKCRPPCSTCASPYDLTGMTLGGGLEYSYGAKFDAFLSTGQVRMERVSSDMQNFEKLLRERIVLYPQEINVGYAALHSHFTPADIAKITHHPKPLLNNLSYLIFPKQLEASQALRERFNRRLQQYRDSGRYEQYFRDLQAGNYQLASDPALPHGADAAEP